MNGFTDKNIPISCSECNVLEEGINAMMSHLLDFHPDYSPAQAANTAQRWANEAYDAEDLRQEALTQYHRGK